MILRADGNEKIGAGHIFRLLALAEMINTEFEVWFVTNTTDEFILNTISKYVSKVIITNQDFLYSNPNERKDNSEIPFDLIDNLSKDDIVVLDGYWFGNNYQKNVKSMGCKLIMIDDFANQHYFSDVIINHAPGVLPSSYKTEKYTKLYLGIEFALIRSVFFEPQNENKLGSEFFICFGASDSNYLSLKYLLVLLENTNYNIHVLTTSLFSGDHLEELKRIQNKYHIRVYLYQDLAENPLKNLLDRCDYALVPSSTILLESISRGLKCITGFYTLNQLNIYNGFVNEHLALGLGDLTKCSTKSIVDIIRTIEVTPLKKPKLNSIMNIKSIFFDLHLR